MGQGRAPKARSESRSRRRQGKWGVGRGRFLPTGRGAWEKGSAPSPEKILDLKVNMAYFRGLCAKFSFFLCSIDLHAIESVIEERLSS